MYFNSLDYCLNLMAKHNSDFRHHAINDANLM